MVSVFASSTVDCGFIGNHDARLQCGTIVGSSEV